jgi:hypothetical protein
LSIPILLPLVWIVNEDAPTKVTLPRARLAISGAMVLDARVETTVPADETAPAALAATATPALTAQESTTSSSRPRRRLTNEWIGTRTR